MYSTICVHTASPTQPSILIMYTGGTLGMVYNALGQLQPFDFEQILSKIPEIGQLDFTLTVITFDTPIDSSNVTPTHWLQWAAIIQEHYTTYDGFVVLHGTDTMAYSASALSFLLDGLNKPVIFTGAQLPMGSLRTDARENMITALEIASARTEEGRPVISEVCIYFHSLLLRGNRSKKVESTQFDAFYSENYPSLAEAGIHIEYRHELLTPYQATRSLSIQTRLNEQVAILKLFPGISRPVVDSILQTKGLQGVVLETYGSGNASTEQWFLQSLCEAVERGLLIFNVSQCMGGRVIQGRYSTSAQLSGIGIVSGSDITTEAAITKLMYVLAKDLPPNQQRQLLETDLRGEMTLS